MSSRPTKSVAHSIIRKRECLMDELEALSNRGYTEGFLRRHPPREYQSYEQGSSFLGTQQVVGTVAEHAGGWLTIDVKNQFRRGDTLELLTPSGRWRFPALNLQDRHQEPIDRAPGSGHVVREYVSTRV